MKVLMRVLASALVVGLSISLCACSSPVAVITNAGSESVSVEIRTDIGESYAVTIPAKESVRLKISGRDKQLWVVATLANGSKLESEKLYVTSQGLVSSTITDAKVSISYKLSD